MIGGGARHRAAALHGCLIGPHRRHAIAELQAKDSQHRYREE